MEGRKGHLLPSEFNCPLRKQIGFSRNVIHSHNFRLTSLDKYEVIVVNYEGRCMMIFTLYNVCAVPWGCSVSWGISWVPWGAILSTVGGVQYRGGYHDKCGGYLEYRGGCSAPWGVSWVPWGLSWVLWRDIMMHVGISWAPWGCSVPWGDTILWNLSTVGDIVIHVGGYHEYRGGCSVPWGT